MVKRPIDIRREGAFSMKVGSPEEGEIVAMISLGDALFTVKERAIYKVVLADQIDPDRTNIAIPHVNQLVAKVGADSHIVARTLMTADALLRKNHLPKEIDLAGGLKLYTDLMLALLAAEEVREALAGDQERARSQLGPIRGGALAMPSVGDVVARANSFIQKAEHSAQILFKVCTIFYRPEDMKAHGPMFDGFAGLMEKLYGADDPHLPYFRKFAESGRLMRNLRHCVEHPGPSQRIIASDYTMTAEVKIAEPMIEIVHPMAPFHKVPLLDFMTVMVEELSLHAEHLVAHLCAKILVPFGGFNVDVGEIPEDQRGKPKNVRYGYLIDIGRGWQRLG